MPAPSTPIARSGRPPNAPLRLYTGMIEGHEITILIGREGRACACHATYAPMALTRRAERYPNARSLSAGLRGMLGFGPSLSLLQAMGVPGDSDLYDLNHDGAAARALLARGPIGV